MRLEICVNGWPIWNSSYSGFMHLRCTVAEYLQVPEYRQYHLFYNDNVGDQMTDKFSHLEATYPFVLPFFNHDDSEGIWTPAECLLIHAFFVATPGAFPRNFALQEARFIDGLAHAANEDIPAVFG